jgi:hypothetical protein
MVGIVDVMKGRLWGVVETQAKELPSVPISSYPALLSVEE